MGKRKITLRQKQEIIVIVKLKNGAYPRYPINYVAALYGITRAYLCKITAQAGVPTRDKYHCKSTAAYNRDLPIREERL